MILFFGIGSNQSVSIIPNIPFHLRSKQLIESRPPEEFLLKFKMQLIDSIYARKSISLAGEIDNLFHFGQRILFYDLKSNRIIQSYPGNHSL